jgi:glutaredoxin 2
MEIIKPGHPDNVKVDRVLNEQFKRDVEQAARRATGEEIQKVVKKDNRLTIAQWMDINLDLISPHYAAGTEFAFVAFHPKKEGSALCLTTSTLDDVAQALKQIKEFKIAQEVAKTE